MAPQEDPQASAPVPPPVPETGEAEAEEPQMSEVARITGVFSSPSAVFRDVGRRPRWWVPVILLTVMATIFSVAFASRVGFDRAIRQALEASPQAQNMSRAQMERIVETGANVAKYGSYGGAVITILLLVVLISAVMKFLFDTIMGADVGFKRMMGIVAYAQLPTLISTALALLVMNLKDPDDFNVTNPLATNVGAFLGSGTSAGLRSMAESIDLFSFWVMILLAIGISTVSRKISFGKALGGVMFPWALYVALKAGAAALRG
jgi:hypothetical protein